MPSVDLVMSEDTFIQSASATTNYNSNTQLYVGESNAGSSINRTLIKPDFTGVPTDAIFKTAILKLTPVGDLATNASVVYCHSVIKATVFSQSTWNEPVSGFGWSAVGCSDSTFDYRSWEVLGFMSVVASPTLNVQLEMTLDASILRKTFDGTYTNYGLVLFTEDQSDDLIQYASTNHATSAYRPIITLTYVLPGGAAAFF